tara:strand:+ start:1064 stop:1276 length:213 start_codon:yes stop_codon:yes gene_type:complete
MGLFSIAKHAGIVQFVHDTPNHGTAYHEVTGNVVTLEMTQFPSALVQQNVYRPVPKQFGIYHIPQFQWQL